MGSRRRTINGVIGETVGSYRIVSKLSIGGMGTVYKAEHALIGKLAAVKVLHPELTTSRDIVNRFFNEAKATTSIKHPGIVEVFDFGYMASGHAYLVMEFLEGMSLARRCKTGGRMGEGDAAMLLRGVCSALSAAHAKGIVHRDLKPDNIFLVPDPDSAIGERPKVLDFGIAKLTDIGLAGTTTKTGAVMGTPTYMSPEQCRGSGEVDHRADLYSIGCIFHELLTGRPPFVNLGAGELIGAHLYVVPDRPSKLLPTISRGSEKLMMALLSKDPAHRPQTAKELGQRFQEIAAQQGWITQSTPAGVTAPSMPLLTPPPSATVHDRASSRSETVEDSPHTLPSKPPGATTPNGLTPPALFVAQATEHDVRAEKPTTLSGSASQSIVEPPRRSRKGLALAMTAAALLAGGSVAFFKLNGAGKKSSTAAASRVDAPTPAPATTAATTTPTTPTTPTTTTPTTTTPTIVATTPTEIGTAVPPKPPAGGKMVATRPVARPTPKHNTEARPALKPMPKAELPKAEPKKPETKKPDPKKPLFETEL